MYKYVLNSVVQISMMFAEYFEYYTIILGGVFSWTRFSNKMKVIFGEHSPITGIHRKQKQGHLCITRHRITRVVIVSHFSCIYLANVSMHLQHARQRTGPRDAVRFVALRCGAGSRANAAYR